MYSNKLLFVAMPNRGRPVASQCELSEVAAVSVVPGGANGSPGPVKTEDFERFQPLKSLSRPKTNELICQSHPISPPPMTLDGSSVLVVIAERFGMMDGSPVAKSPVGVPE